MEATLDSQRIDVPAKENLSLQGDRGVTPVANERGAFFEDDASRAIMDYFERGSPEARAAILLFQRVMASDNNLGNKVLQAVTLSLNADEMKNGDDVDGSFVLGLLHGLSVGEH